MSQQFLIVNSLTDNEQSPVSQSNLPTFNQFQIDRRNQFLQPCTLNNSDGKSVTSQVKFIPVVSSNQLLTNLGQNQVHDNVSSKTSQINSPLLVVGINNQIPLKDQIHSANGGSIAIQHSMNADGNSKLSTINRRLSSNSPLIEHHELIPVKPESSEITYINEIDSDNSLLSDPGKDDLMIGDNEAVIINRNVKVESDGNTFFIKEETPFPRNASVELVEDYASFVEDAIKSEHSDEESVADIAEEREEFIEMKDDNFYDIELKDPLQTEETCIIEKDIKDPLQSEVPGIAGINLNNPLQSEEHCIKDKDLKDPLGSEEPVKDPLETIDSDFMDSDPLHTEEPIVTISNYSKHNWNAQFVRVKNTDPPLYRRVICNYVATTPTVSGLPQQHKSNSQKGSGQGNSSVHYVKVKKTNPPLYRKVICKNDDSLLKRKQIQNLLNSNQPITSSAINAVTKASIPAPRLNGHSLSNLPINSTALNAIATTTIPAPRINGQSRSNLSTNSIAMTSVPATSILAPGINSQRRINIPITSAAMTSVPATSILAPGINSQRRINIPITSAAINTVPTTSILAPGINSQRRINIPITSAAINPVPATSILPPAVNSQSRINLPITATGRPPQPQLKLVSSNNKEVNMIPASTKLANNTSGAEVPGLSDYRLFFVRVPDSNPPTFRRVVGNVREPTKLPVATTVNNSQPKSNVPFISSLQAKNPGVISYPTSSVQNINSKSTPTTYSTAKYPGASSIPIANVQNIKFKPTSITNSTGIIGNTVLRLPEKPKDQELQYAQHQYIKIRDNPPLYQRILVLNQDQNNLTKKKQ